MAGNEAGPLTFLPSQRLTAKAKTGEGRKSAERRARVQEREPRPLLASALPPAPPSYKPGMAALGGGRGAEEEPSLPAQPQVGGVRTGTCKEER